jgi:secreted trypsin-like serine protease
MMLLMKTISFSLCLTCISLMMVDSRAIIIRHDVGPSRYEASSRDWPAVFFLERQGRRKVCVATVIHPQWAITAAHCIAETSLQSVVANGSRFAVEVAGGPREIDRVSIHPGYDITSPTDVDLALLRFNQPANMPQPIPVNLQETELNKIVSILGWGYFGLGTTGRQYNDGSLRLATNRISEAGRRLRISFDDPRDRNADSLELEGLPGLGDSGGPALIKTSLGFSLAGVAVGEVEGEDFSEETQGKYGSVAVYERLSLHLDWIEAVIGSPLPFGG